MATQKAKSTVLQKGLKKFIELRIDNPFLLKTNHLETALPKTIGPSTWLNGTEDEKPITICMPFAAALVQGAAIAVTEVTETNRPDHEKSVFTLEAYGDLYEVSIDGNKTELFLVTECVDMKKDRPIRKLH